MKSRIKQTVKKKQEQDLLSSLSFVFSLLGGMIQMDFRGFLIVKWVGIFHLTLSSSVRIL